MNSGKYIAEFPNEITRKNFRITSIKNYVSCLTKFLAHFDSSVTKPSEINEQMLKDYLRSFPDHNTQLSQPHFQCQNTYCWTGIVAC
jgi:hypothetical protein